MKRQNAWYKKRRRELKREFGGKCMNPDCEVTRKLEFAHKTPTKLNGRGRGSNHRVLDILRNRDSYILLCSGCHVNFDLGKLKI